MDQTLFPLFSHSRRAPTLVHSAAAAPRRSCAVSIGTAGIPGHGDTGGQRWVHGHSGVGGRLALHPGHAGRRVAAANRGPPPGGECRGAGARHGQRWGSRPAQSLRWSGGKPVQFESVSNFLILNQSYEHLADALLYVFLGN